MTDLFSTQSAVLSHCGTYRYLLDRGFASGGSIASIGMVNPSTADSEANDQTIRKLCGFADKLGISKFTVWNKFAFRSADVQDLRTAADPIGPRNDEYIEMALRAADIHIVAWGSLAKLPPALRDRWREVMAIAGRVGVEFQCLDICADGHPSHPLMLSYDRDLRPWSPPDGGADV